MPQPLITQIENIISNKTFTEQELLYNLKNLLYEFEIQNININDSKNIANLISGNINLLNQNNKPVNTIKTGFIEFDKIYGGFNYGEFVVIGGRPSMGKTQLLVNLSLNISASIPVLYFTFDLSEYLLSNRFISSISKIPVAKILQYDITKKEKEILLEIQCKIKEHKIFVNESCNSSLTSFKAHCKKQIQENGVKVIIVDYLQMMSSHKYKNNRDAEIGYITHELKNIAKDNNVCVIASSQLSRAVENRCGSKRPELSDLRDSGAIEQDADKVLFIYRPEYYGIDMDINFNNTAGLTELIVAKNRNGKIGTVKLLRDNNFTHFRDFDNYNENLSFSKERLNEIE